MGFATGFLLDLAVGGTMGVSSLVLHRRRLRRRPLPRGARPRPRADADRRRRAGHAGLRAGVRRRVVHARRRRHRQPARVPRHARHRGAERHHLAARVLGLPAHPAPVAGRRPARHAAAAGRARARPARSACAGWRSDRVHGRRRPPALADAPARAAGGDRGRHRAGGLRGRVLPPLVPAGAVGRQVPRRGQRQPRARDQGAGAARRDRGPRRQGAGEQPHRPGRARDAQDAAGQARGAARDLPPAGAGAQPVGRADRAAGGPPAQGAARTRRPRSSRTCRRPPSTSCSRTRRTSPASRSSRSSCASTRTARWARSCSASCARPPRSSSTTSSATAASASATGSGQSGIESQYDRFLRGRNGASRVQVDALGNLRGQLRNRRPEQGRQLRLSLDLGVQEAGQQALGGARGAFAVMNVRDGEVLALGSSPSFDPNQFSKVLPPVGVQAPDVEGERRAADQPRHLGGLSHRLHVQADHRHRRPPGRADHARHRAVRRRLAEDRQRRCSRTPATWSTARWRCARRCRCPATCSSTASARRPTARATGC